MATILSARHRRILNGLSHDDLVWEVPGQPYFTQFNERTGKQARVRLEILEEMEQAGWIRRCRQSVAAHKLDFWDITNQGREAVSLAVGGRKTPASDRVPSPSVTRRSA